jgi:hypothetical protein
MELEFSRQIFEKYSNIKFHKIYPSIHGVPGCFSDGRTDMTKLIMAFRNFEKPLVTLHSGHSM